MTPYSLLPLLFCLLMAQAWSAPGTTSQIVLVESQRSARDASHDFYVDLLQLALNNSRERWGEAKVEEVSGDFSQSRAFAALNSGQLHVFWAGTSKQRQQRFRAIEVPLFAGLLGVRVPVIRRDRLAEFRGYQTLVDWQGLLACQGSQWPDSDILEANGFRVTRIAKFDLMYSMLKQGRCDYFPRGLNEVGAELAAVGQQDLMAYEDVLITYPFPMYFFVAKDNEALYQRLSTSLEAMAASGELRHFLFSHPTTAGLFPLARFDDSLRFRLTNALLPESTPLQRPELWLPLARP
ncbi:substrate-binding periplasmic protein [Shewanella sedimentimangrovi]|uniref:Transporter substrate-binding domain-containing protein n=1 Tax=Shewanella sedimentimangrovi TaxID=2814293 RepID=A0ABX7R0V8_9GAMM|nr:transporter substrate-binding domain-containing protein [Shewanella sedimentimangrovi]QSX37424.1 transporter substrate-binding domain-containing protein [Shewanella sedimentimangrovi]